MTQDSDNDPLATGGALGVLAELKDDSDDPLAGRTLGAYEIVSIIASGGMGRVYRARRADGSIDREVAIKVSATSGLSDELRSRFAQEQNVLASLNHPNICQLYDADVSDDGWPYFVMELVDGNSIVDYCQTNDLGVRERLRLLTHVVDAVAYAHSQLVVHRDIKPANVLVNANNEVKLLDFGIAKLLEPDAKLTQGAPLTPRYASPEQLLGQPITVASDISQLGLLIYEVLNGEPLNPSETLADAIQRAADGRSLRVELDRARELPREVLPIVEHCLRADPSDRYADANSLKADIRAYLNGYPVSAVGQSTGYRARKFVQRNSLPIFGSVGAGVAIAAGIQIATWLGTSNPCGDPSGRLAGIWDDTARAAVTRSFLDSGFTYAPTLASSVVGTMDRYAADWQAMHVEACEANRVLGSQSDELFDKRMMCLNDRLTVMGTLSSRFSVADMETMESAPKALESLKGLGQCADLEHLSSTIALPPPEKEQVVTDLKRRAAEIQTDITTNHFADAKSKITELRSAAIATNYAPLVAEAELLNGQILSNYSDVAAKDAYVAALTSAANARDDYLIAEGWIEYVYALAEHLSDESAQPLLLGAQTAVARLNDNAALKMRLLNTEGALAYRGGKHQVARDRFAEALAVAENAGLARAEMIRLNLAAAYREIGELEQSRDLSLLAFEALADRSGPDSPLAMRAIESLVIAYKELGEHEVSNEYARQVIEIYTANLGAGHQKVANAKRNLAWALKETGHLEEAKVLMLEALDIFGALESPPDWAIASLNNDLGDLLMYLEDLEVSETHLDASLAIWGRDPDSVWAEFPLVNLGFLYNRTNRYENALDYCNRALALRRGVSTDDHPAFAYSLSCIGEALIGLGRPADAIEPAQQSVDLRLSNVSYELGWSRLLHARALQLSGQQAAGDLEMREAMQIFAEHPPVDPHMAAMAAAWNRDSPD